jgi:hypothetical protein
MNNIKSDANGSKSKLSTPWEIPSQKDSDPDPEWKAPPVRAANETDSSARSWTIRHRQLPGSKRWIFWLPRRRLCSRGRLDCDFGIARGNSDCTCDCESGQNSRMVNEVFYRKPTQEWVRVISLEKAPGAFLMAALGAFGWKSTVLRGRLERRMSLSTVMPRLKNHCEDFAT